MSTETPGRAQYTLIHGTHGRFEDGVFVQYARGDKIELTDKEADALKGRIEPVSVSGASPDADAGSTDAEWSFLDDLHHVKAVEFVRGLDDSEQVQATLDYELAHKNRPSVTFAAKDRMKEIATSGADSESQSDSDEDEG